MGGNRATGRWYIAPSDHDVVLEGDDLGIAALDITLHESAYLFDRRRFQEGEVLALPGNDVDGGTEAVRVVYSDLAEFDGHGAARYLIRSIAELFDWLDFRFWPHLATVDKKTAVRVRNWRKLCYTSTTRHHRATDFGQGKASSEMAT